MSSAGWSCDPSSSGRPQVGHRPGQSGRSSGAIGSASEMASQTDGSEIELVMIGEPEGLGFLVGRDGLAAREVDRRQELVLDRQVERHGRRPQAADTFRRERRPQSRLGEDAAVRVDQPDVTADRLGQRELLGQLDRGVGDVEDAVGADRVAEQPGDVPDELTVGGSGGHPRPVTTGRARRRPPPRRPSRRP